MKHMLTHLSSVTSAWRRVLLMIWRVEPWFVLGLLVSTLLSALVPSMQIQLTSSIIQSAALAIRTGHSQHLINQVLLFGGLQGGLLLVLALLSLVSEQLQALLVLRLNNKISIEVMEKAASLNVQHYEDAEFYDKLQRASGESGFRPYQIFSAMTSLAGQIVTLVSVVGVLVSWNWWLGLLILLAPLPSVGSRFFYSRRSYLIEQGRAPERRRLAYFQFLVTHASPVKEIRLFRLASYLMKRYTGIYQEFYKVDSRLMRQQALMLFPFAILTPAAAASAQLYAITTTISSGQLGLLAGYLQAIGVVQITVLSLLIGVTKLYQNNLYVNNLFEFLNTPVGSIKSGIRQMPELMRKGIEFRGVSFVYPGTETVVLDNLNLFLATGESVALVGHNGAGKTTLVKLLTRLYEPTEGQILIDNVPLEEYDLDDLRRHISAIFQDFVQYEMKVKENVGFGFIEEIEKSERIVQAARESGADKMIGRLPRQYETMLGRMFARGEQLSGGQWQKIALARAFMRRTPIVVFDEPTASLDAEAETEIFERLEQLAAGAITLLVAHRFSTVRRANRILVIEQGKIIEDGSHQELLRLNGQYARLFRLQAAGYAESAS